MKKIITLLVAVLTLTALLAIVSTADDYYVYDAADLDGNVSFATCFSPELLKANDTLYYRINTFSSGTGGDSTEFEIKLANIATDFYIKDYPVVKIGYKSNVADASAEFDVNVGLDYQGKATRVWGIRSGYVKNGNDSSTIINISTKATGGEGIKNYSWDNVDADSYVNYLRIKPNYSGRPYSEGEYIDIEYVAFFKDEASAEAFDFDFDFNVDYSDLYLKEQVRRLVVGESASMNIAYKPVFLNEPVGVTYVSADSNIASVDASGKVTAVSAGTTTITASYGTFNSVCKIIVLSEAIKPIKLISSDIATDTENVIVSSLGDSITTYTPGSSNSNYHDWWAKWYHLTNEDKGISGTKLSGTTETAFVNRYGEMRDDADLVTVKGGTNDFGGTSKGTNSDRTVTTYMGALRILMEGLIEKYPDRQIVFFTPIKRCENNQTPATKNSFGDTLNDYANAVEEIGAAYGIPVVNLYTPEELDFTSTVISLPGHDENGVWHDAVCESELMPDGLHPSASGQKIMAEYMMTAMRKLGVVEFDLIYGDVNGSGRVDATDSVVLSRYLAKWSGYSDMITEANCDLDGNTVIDATDSVILSRYLASWSGYESLPFSK